MDILPRANNVLNINPPVEVEEALSLHGSDWLWAVTAIYAICFLGLLVLCFVAPPSNRVFHYTFTMALLVGTVTYYAQASDLGWSAVEQVNQLSHGSTRQIFWAKYINWVVAFPSFALSLGLLAGVSWTTIISNIFLSWFWILTYLAAAYTATNYKWGFFAFGTFAWIILAMSTVNESHESASALGIGRDYLTLSGWLNFLWLLYPIAFGLSDGGNLISVTDSFIFFGILDLLMLPVLSFAFVVLGRNWDFGKLNLAFSEYRGYRPGEVLIKDDVPEANETAASS
ncbi:family A G protein-coupled receptor-like protein [Aspergillus sclerotiicarbonarius CBS 121057]|uniref:Family A G protein-coupled receptor-like protein n=1 Tax=Aspergillus sclerotiicarbonarius (strain CBS 121057 / IBT 28362) TaxID=1448318 RepID=A0A319EU50_ASPSB|nr:family A G protein-coupled receptor-like protein [Aspergillus sclerotiicarbonarius CBS 121057]